MPHVPSDKLCTFGSNWNGEKAGFLLAFTDMVWFILGWNFWDCKCITLTNSGCYRKYMMVCITLHVQKKDAYWLFPGIWVCWGKLMDSRGVILVTSYLAFVISTPVVVIIMYSPQESVWAVICHQYTILYFPSLVPSRKRWWLGTARIDLPRANCAWPIW